MVSILISTLIFFPVIQKEAKQIDPTGIYVNVPLSWKSPPRKLKKSYFETSAEVATFYPNGDFEVIYCMLFKGRKTGLVSICEGCGFSLYVGTWKRGDGDLIAVRSKRVEGMLRVGETLPGPELEAHWQIRDQSSKREVIEMGASPQQFQSLRHLTNPDFLSRLLKGYSIGKT